LAAEVKQNPFKKQGNYMKRNLIILIIGLLLGAWIGPNLIRDRDPFANPLQSDALVDRLKDGGSDLLEGSKDVLQDGIDKLKK